MNRCVMCGRFRPWADLMMTDPYGCECEYADQECRRRAE